MEFINLARFLVYWFTLIVLVSWLGLIGAHGCVAAVKVASDPDRGKTRWEKNPWDNSRSVFDSPRSEDWSK